MDAPAVPPAALRDINAMVLAPVWIAEQGLHCSLKSGLYAADGVARETAAWGIILADLAGHVADALSAAGMGAKADLFEVIVDGFNEEVSAPSSTRMGQSGAGSS
ncbi:DUF5076 domain-containing protein [Caulobacter henricii]|uniref:DUF5076 domain-containing protein n=1 Tax=Caulobacter henricii TaxID=69395 RepID=UPI00214F2378|nr:DUF5076 domain-containing protein [Caulobacter henricii]